MSQTITNAGVNVEYKDLYKRTTNLGVMIEYDLMAITTVGVMIEYQESTGFIKINMSAQMNKNMSGGMNG